MWSIYSYCKKIGHHDDRKYCKICFALISKQQSSWLDTNALIIFYILQKWINVQKSFDTRKRNETLFYQSLPQSLSLPQSSKRCPPTTEVMGSIPVSNIWSHVARVRQHSAESCGFSPGSPVSSHIKCWPMAGLFQLRGGELKTLKSRWEICY